MPQDTKPRPAAVYRLYDAAGRLLYIGSAYAPEERCKAHRSKPWWPMVAHRTEEWRDGRIDAYIAEMEAIRAEDPPCNVMGTPRYACPDTPGIRRRNELNARRARAKRDAEQRRSEVWEAARAQGLKDLTALCVAEAAYIDVLDQSGVWPVLVAELQSDLHEQQERLAGEAPATDDARPHAVPHVSGP